MKITLIAAMTDQGIIGVNNQMPWHLPEDFKHFKARTLGKIMIMGSNTYRSIGRPLPGRSTIVLTRKEKLSLNIDPAQEEALEAQGFFIDTAKDIHAAISQAKANDPQLQEIMIAGGGQVYQECLPLATHMNLTLIHKNIDGDTFFPSWDKKHWRIIQQTNQQQTQAPYLSYSFVDLEAI